MRSLSKKELFEGKELDIVGKSISAVTLDSNIVISIYQHEFRSDFRIESSFKIEDTNKDITIEVVFEPFRRDKYTYSGITKLAEIVNCTVVGARVYLDGLLELCFDNGFIITVQPDENYEAWTYTGQSGLLICTPGGVF
ncbi:MAG: DUF6188 family protein [Firmicutes bacterium]|jgi:hypothetical protein|nr:DUF6188 family protein [Bacillota bacterium]